jgi:uncharacterized repeat protein (TIGR01451 family)
MAADLEIKIHGPGQIVSGEAAVYTVTIFNHGPAIATGIMLEDSLPTGATPVWSHPALPLCAREGSDVRCGVGDLSASEGLTITLDLSASESIAIQTEFTQEQLATTCRIVSDSFGAQSTCPLAPLPPGTETKLRVAVRSASENTGALIHTGAIRARETDPDLANNHTTYTTRIVSASARPTGPNLVLQAEVPKIVISGRPFTTTLTVTNQGSVDATGVRLENVLPLATILNAFTPGLPDCEQAGDRLTCTLRDPDSGETMTFTLVITGYEEEPMILEPDPLVPGWPICTVLKEHSYLHILLCEIGRLKPGQSARVEMVLTATGVQEREIVNAATVSAYEEDPNPLNNTSTTTSSVQTRADLWLWSSRSGAAPPKPSVEYILHVVNLGPSDASGVVLVDSLPAGVSLVSADAGPAAACLAERSPTSNETVICRLGRLNRGETARVKLHLLVDDSHDFSLDVQVFHHAHVNGDQVDLNPANNELKLHIPFPIRTEE